MRHFRFFMLAAVSVLAISGAAHAQRNVRDTVPDSQPAQKSVRDMTPDERRAYWNSLPAEDQQRILDRRRQISEERMKNGDFDKLSNDEKAARMNRDQDYPRDPSAQTQPSRRDVQRWEDLSEKRQAAAKAQWEAMSPDEKRAFLTEHREELEAVLRAQAGK